MRIRKRSSWASGRGNVPSYSIGFSVARTTNGSGRRVGYTVDGDLSLFHCFQQRGLGLRRGAVDLVGEDELGDDGTGPVFEATGLLVEDVDPGHIAGEEIGGELDALEGTADRARDRLGQDRLADAGDVLDEDVTATEQRDKHEEHLVPLTDDDSLDVIADQARDSLDSAGIHQLR